MSFESLIYCIIKVDIKRTPNVNYDYPVRIYTINYGLDKWIENIGD